MDQENGAENGSKDSNKSTKTVNGRASGSLGSGMAMKIPGKQNLKNSQQPRKGRQTKSGSNSATAPSELPNGNGSHLKTGREGKRANKDEKSGNRLSPSLGQKSKSQTSSRNNSASPTNRLEGGDAAEKRPPKSEPEKVDLTDIEVSSNNLKQLLSIGNPSRISYSRIQLLNISENPSSKHRPECLEKDFNASNGRWDPETWHRSFSPPTTPGDKLQKFTIPETRDRFVDDPSAGGLVLGPQRRSFQDGCHVTSTTASRLSKLHLSSPTETSRHGRPRLVLRQRSEADYESSSTPTRERQIESASALRSEEFDWERRGDGSRFRGERDLSDLRPEPRGRGPRELPRDLHELRSEFSREHRDGDYKDYRDRDHRERKFSHSREYGNSGNNWYQSQPRGERRERRYDEPEPEWYTDGPTSQFDTIELAGFEEETPAAAADFSSWGGEIPMDDLDMPGKEGEKENADELEEEQQEPLESAPEQKELEGEAKEENKTEEQTSAESTSTAPGDSEKNVEDISELDFNDMLGIPGFSSVMEQILKENSVPIPTVPGPDKPADTTQAGGSASRFSQWFQKVPVKNESGSGVSTPHEELENLAELAAERGLASPTDLETKMQQTHKNDLMRLLAQAKSESSNYKPDPTVDQQELARELLRQQMKMGSVMNAAELEAKAGARRSPSQSYGVDVQNTDAFNKLVASIREKDKIKHRQQQQQQRLLQQSQFQGKGNINMAGGRIPSPEELAAHTQNIFQQALIKKQLEKQKDAYREKVRQMEQHRREEQLREAIRSADAKMQESKLMNKSLAFMPTSVMRKMQETRDGKMAQNPEEMMAPGEAEDIASATASFSAKLANSGKKMPPSGDPMAQHNNELLARIYQSAGAPKRNENPGLRRNASFPEVLMDGNKISRSSAFHQPLRQNIAANSMDLGQLSGADMESARLRNLLSMPNEMPSANLLNKPSKPLKSGNLAADIYNNNTLKAEGGKFDRASPNVEHGDKHSEESDIKNQHEVALLTHYVLKKFGISEDQLSRLTPQQQQMIVNIVQEQYYQLQAQKQRLLHEKKAKDDGPNPLRLKQGDLPPPNVSKNEIMGGIVNKNPKLDQNDPRSMGQTILNPALQKPVSSQPPTSMGIKFPSQQASIPGVSPTGFPGLLPTTNPQLHPLQLRSLVPPPPMQLFPPPMARGAPMIPTTFLSPQTHIPGRIMAPPPPNVSLASPLGAPYPAAALMQMQFYQQQQRALLTAAAIQQQQQMAQAQAIAAARQQQNKDPRGDFNNPLERWFGREVLSQSQLPAMQKPNALTLNDIERGNNQKQE